MAPNTELSEDYDIQLWGKVCGLRSASFINSHLQTKMAVFT